MFPSPNRNQSTNCLYDAWSYFIGLATFYVHWSSYNRWRIEIARLLQLFITRIWLKFYIEYLHKSHACLSCVSFYSVNMIIICVSIPSLYVYIICLCVCILCNFNLYGWMFSYKYYNITIHNISVIKLMDDRWSRWMSTWLAVTNLTSHESWTCTYIEYFTIIRSDIITIIIYVLISLWYIHYN